MVAMRIAELEPGERAQSPRSRPWFHAACLLLAAFLPGAAHADGLGFKGAELGSPLARVASDPRHECNAVNTPLGDTICSMRTNATETIAGAPVISLFYFYDIGTLTSIQVTVAEKDFQRVVDALAAKYGPGKLSTEKVKNLKGVEFENRTYLWTRPDGSLQAQRYSGSLDKSVIRYSDDSAAGRVQQRRAAVAKDPKKDL
jgi:hypothetical protein